MEDWKMAEKDSFVSNFVKGITGKFSPKAKKLDDIPLDDLNRESLRLENAERTFEIKVDKLEAQKKDLFAQGTRTNSDRERRMIARQMQEVETEIKSNERMLIGTTKQKRVIKGLILLKREQEYLANSEVGSVIKSVDITTLTSWITDQTSESDLNLDRVEEMLGSLETGDMVRRTHTDDTAVDDLVRQMSMAHDDANNPETLDERFKEANDSLKSKKDQENRERE
jgi:hypothetical protein